MVGAGPFQNTFKYLYLWEPNDCGRHNSCYSSFIMWGTLIKNATVTSVSLATFFAPLLSAFLANHQRRGFIKLIILSFEWRATAFVNVGILSEVHPPPQWQFNKLERNPKKRWNQIVCEELFYFRFVTAFRQTIIDVVDIIWYISKWLHRCEYANNNNGW